MRATIIVDVSKGEDRTAAAVWLDRWRDRLSFVSENEGCGCCVDIWNVDGPEEAVTEIPSSIRGSSEWAG